MRESSRDRSFGPTVLAGVAAAASAAVASGRDWATSTGDAAGVTVAAATKGSSSAPLAIALSLVSLAAWGAVLVLRGRVRRLVAVLGVLASAGTLVTVLVSTGRTRADAVAAAVAHGASGRGVDVSLTGWYVVATVASLVCLGAFVVAVLRCPRWPAMGTRYDAPASRPAATDQDLWRAIDEGHDPTA
jgi:uncharacterized membrane protein (TIGR02234 family)